MTTEVITPAATPPPDMFAQLDAPADEGVSVEPAAPVQAVAATEKPTPTEALPTPTTPVVESAPERQPERIPLAVLLEERRKSEEREAGLRARIEALENKPEAAVEAATPDFMEDPKGYVDAKLAKATEALRKLEEGSTKEVAEVRQLAAEQAVASAIAAASDQFAAKQKDFGEALQFARTTRAKQIEILNPGLKPEQVIQIVGSEERQLAATLVRQGVDPAERVYRLAQSMGYTAKQAPSPVPSSPNVGEVISPDTTLNTTPGTAPDAVEEEEPEMLTLARKERFGNRRR